MECKLSIINRIYKRIDKLLLNLIDKSGDTLFHTIVFYNMKICTHCYQCVKLILYAIKLPYFVKDIAKVRV